MTTSEDRVVYAPAAAGRGSHVCYHDPDPDSEEPAPACGVAAENWRPIARADAERRGLDYCRHCEGDVNHEHGNPFDRRDALLDADPDAVTDGGTETADRGHVEPQQTGVLLLVLALAVFITAVAIYGAALASGVIP